MNWRQLISDLLADGMTQREIAERVGVTQGAISQVLRDTEGRRGFKYEPGQRLIDLHVERCITATDDTQPPAGRTPE